MRGNPLLAVLGAGLCALFAHVGLFTGYAIWGNDGPGAYRFPDGPVAHATGLACADTTAMRPSNWRSWRPMRALAR